MKHTINDSWEFMSRDKDCEPGTTELYGIRWSDGHEVLFKDMPEKQTLAYIKRAGIQDLMGHTTGKANN